MPTRKKTAPKKTAARKAPKPSPKPRKPSQLDLIEGMLADLTKQVGLDSHNSIMSHLQMQMGFRNRMCNEHKEIMSQLTSPSQPTVEQAAPQPEGLQPGDYTDASKEVADALTAMGYVPLTPTSFFGHPYIGWAHGSIIEARAGLIEKGRLTTSEFLSRAAVTAKEIGLVPVVEKWVPVVGQLVVGSDGAVRRVREVSDTFSYLWADGVVGPQNYSDFRPATDAEIQQHLAEQEARKPILPYVTRVMCQGDEYRVVSVPSGGTLYELHKPYAPATMKAKRHEFTVID